MTGNNISGFMRRKSTELTVIGDAAVTMATSVPGSAGLPLVSDKSYDFYKDPIRFQNKHMEMNKSRVFLSRFLNKPTVFIGSNRVIQETLQGKSCTVFLLT